MLEEKLRLEKRTVQYWYEDGIPEIGLGSTCLFFAGFYVINILAAMGNVFLKVILLTAMISYSYFCGRFLVRAFHALKEKWTYPRAGRVRYRGQDDLGQRPWTLKRLGLVIPVTAAMLALREYLPASSFLMIAMLGLVVLLVHIAWRSGKARFYAFAILAVGTGALLLASSGIPLNLRIALFWVFHGIALTASGILTLRRFIKTHPIPHGDEA